MKKSIITAFVIFSALLAAVTAVLCNAYENTQTAPREYAVDINEIEQLVTKGDTEAALVKSGELKSELSESSSDNDDTAAYMWTLAAVCTAVVAAAFVYIWFSVLRPFEKLSVFAERIAAGDFDLPLNYERTNYFGKFTWAFDCMRREISAARACEKQAIENNKTVIASLSHDIKTPVASIRAYAEALEAGLDATPEKRAKYLSVIMRKCDEVASLTNDMLLHSVSDLDKLKMDPAQLELCSFIKETVFEISAKDNIRLEIPEYPVYISADRSRLTQAFENIISNAAKYAKTDVVISAEKTSGGVQIAFRDFGKGVPDEELPFIFDKFYRGSRIGKENGAGLGLHIVKYIVTRSGGEVFAENLPDGFLIKILLPTIEIGS